MSDLGFWAKVKKSTSGSQSSNALKVDAIFATDNSGSMNSYLNWEDDPAAVDAFNRALSEAGIGAQNLEILDSNNCNRISRTYFGFYKQQVVSNLLLVRTNFDLSGASIGLGDSFTITRNGAVVGSAGDYKIYAWDRREDYYDSTIIYNELVFQGANNQGAGILSNVLGGDAIEDQNGNGYGTVTEVIQLNNPYLYYVEGDLRLRYFWSKRPGPSGAYVKNSSDGASTGANSEDAFGIIHKTIGVNLNCNVAGGIQYCDDFKPQASSKLVFVANTNEHDTPMPFNVDNTRDLLLKYNGVYVGNIGGTSAGSGVGILPHVRNSADYNGGTNGVSAADPRGFQPIDDYISDVIQEPLTPADALDGIPPGWYRGVEFEIKDVETATSSAEVQARTRPKVRLDIKVDTAVGDSNQSVTVLKVVFPGYGYVVGDTITPPSSNTSTFGALHDILVLKVVRTKDIYYGSASKKIFSGVYTKDFNRMVFLNEEGGAAAFTVVSGGTGYSATTNTATAFDIDQASGFNNAGPGEGATVDLTVGAGGVVTAAAVNAAGTKYNDGDRIIVNNPTAGEILTLDASSLVGGEGYSNATAVSTSNLSDLADGSGATVDITTSGGIVTAVTLNAGGLNYKAGDVLEISGGGSTTAKITVATAKEDCVIQVNGLSNPAAALRERAYLVKDINLITRNNVPPQGTQPQTGGVEQVASNQFTVSTTAGSNVLTVTGTGSGASIANLIVGNEIWNAANTTSNGSNSGAFSLNPTVPWDVKVTATDAGANTITMDAAANATSTGTVVYIGTRRASSSGWRWDHTTLAKETGGAMFFQVGPFSSPIGNAPAGTAWWDNSGGNNSYGSHAWETVAIFGNLGSGTPDYRIQFGRSIGTTVGEYLFKTA